MTVNVADSRRLEPPRLKLNRLRDINGRPYAIALIESRPCALQIRPRAYARVIPLTVIRVGGTRGGKGRSELFRYMHRAPFRRVIYVTFHYKLLIV